MIRLLSILLCGVVFANALPAQSAPKRSEITVTVEARDFREEGKILRLYLTLYGTGVTQRNIKDLDARTYSSLRELQLPGKVGGPLLIDRVGEERTASGYLWQGVRIWEIDFKQVSERQIAFYRKQVESSGYEVRNFRFPITEMDASDFRRVEAAATTEAQRQAERIASARGLSLGAILETEWLNSEIGDGSADQIRLRVVFATREDS